MLVRKEWWKLLQKGVVFVKKSQSISRALGNGFVFNQVKQVKNSTRQKQLKK